MSILSWNCRGLGQPRIVQGLSRLVCQFCPKIVFISETRQQNSRVSNLRYRLGFKNAFVVDGKGKGEGLVLF
jgi:exonuclease III